MSLTVGFWVLAAIGVLSEFGAVASGDRRRRGVVFLSACTSVAILFVWGISPALAAQTAACLVAALRSRLGPASTGILLARALGALLAAGLVVYLFGLGNISPPLRIDLAVLAGIVAVVVAWLLVYFGPVVVVERWLRHETWRTIARRGVGAEILASAALLFLAPVLVTEPRGWTFALLALPLIALNQLASLVGRQASSLRLDRTTGGLNQRGLIDVSEELGRHRRGEPGRYAVLLIRLRTLRDLDDAFGRSVVDGVLAAVAGRLITELGDKVAVGRPDSDDLVALVDRNDDFGGRGSDGRGPGDDRVEAVLAAINRAVARPVVVGGLPYDPAATIGVARAPEDAGDVPALLRQADAAIRYGEVGPDHVARYRPAPHEETRRRLHLLGDLRAALTDDRDAGGIEFVYQPQVRVADGSVIAAEALLRWHHPVRGRVSSEELFRVAEPTALIHDVTTRAIVAVTQQMRAWNDTGIRLPVAVNVSIRDLLGDRFVEDTLAQLDRAGVAADQLVIEITEREVISDPDHVRGTIDQLSKAGIHVAVDDFGSGFASLQHLRQLRLDQMKIDKELVRSVARSSNDRAVVVSLIELSRALGLTVIAEGVEDAAVHETLRELECPMAQGWFYGRPTTGAQLAQRLHSERGSATAA